MNNVIWRGKKDDEREGIQWWDIPTFVYVACNSIKNPIFTSASPFSVPKKKGGEYSCLISVLLFFESLFEGGRMIGQNTAYRLCTKKFGYLSTK